MKTDNDSGPYSRGEIIIKLKCKEIGSKTLLRLEGAESWAPAGENPCFRATLLEIDKAFKIGWDVERQKQLASQSAGSEIRVLRIRFDQSFRRFRESARKITLRDIRDMMAGAGLLVVFVSLLIVGGHFVSRFVAEQTAGEPLAAVRRGVNTFNAMPLINAIRRNNVAAVKSILAQNPQLANAEGSTEPSFERPLVEAVMLRRSACVELLLQHGAAVNSATDDVHILHIAIAIDRDRPDDATDIRRMVELLLAHGAAVNARMGSGTPLDCAMNLEPKLRIPEVEAMLKSKGGTNSVKFRPRQ